MSAAELKEKGNDLFKKGRFIQAIDSYSEALKLSDNKHEKAVFYKNRAAAHLKQVCMNTNVISYRITSNTI